MADTDLELEQLQSEDDDQSSGPDRYDLLTYPADWTLEVLYQKWRNGDIKVPPFQRRFVWTQVQASRLIESFLLGLPVPAIFLYTEPQTNKLLVVDGQQRLRSVFYFFEGFFGEAAGDRRTVFKLKLNDTSPYTNLTCSELPEEIRRTLKDSVLRAFVMRQVTPEGDTSIFHVFERLNTGGTLLLPHEVRNCVLDGPFNELLRTLNEQSEWREILGRPAPDRRMRDQEFILRFFALEREADRYAKPMKNYLSEFMRRNRDGAANATLEALFRSVAQRVRAALGAKPFHLRGGFNAAVFDAVFVAFARHPGADVADTTARYAQLRGMDDFLRLTRTGTTDVETVRRRIEIAERTLFPPHA